MQDRRIDSIFASTKGHPSAVNHNLLAEAIQDARAVRETALLNAKKALDEVLKKENV
jgi:hypothetical protein